jgi:hypothetical protein
VQCARAKIAIRIYIFYLGRPVYVPRAQCHSQIQTANRLHFEQLRFLNNTLI